jgi:hypothetical protein
MRRKTAATSRVVTRVLREILIFFFILGIANGVTNWLAPKPPKMEVGRVYAGEDLARLDRATTLRTWVSGCALLFSCVVVTVSAGVIREWVELRRPPRSDGDR